MFLTGTAWTHVQRGRRSRSSLTSISLSHLSSCREHSKPIPGKGEIIYTGYKEAAEPESGRTAVLRSVPAQWQGIYLLSLMIVHVYIGIWGPPPISELAIISPFVRFPFLLTGEVLGSKRSNGWGEDGRAPRFPHGITPGCISFGAFLEESSDQT